MGTLSPTKNPDEFSSHLRSVAQKYPKLAPYLPNVVVQHGKTQKDDPRSLEFYPPWESENPNPGKITLELFKSFSDPKELQTAVAGDLLHYLGGVNPETNRPVDPNYFALKQKVDAARTPQQQALDQRVYQEEKSQYGENRSYHDWLYQSRLDAYIRGFVTPDANDEWRKKGFYSTPNMKKAVSEVQSYLETK